MSIHGIPDTPSGADVAQRVTLDPAPTAALRRTLLHALSAEQRRRRRGGTPADATALTAAEAKRARKRERNRDRLG